MHHVSKGWIVLLLSYILLTASTCEEPAEPGPSPKDLTKEKRERFGDLLHEAILQAPNDFPILDRASKGDSVVQTYLQTLYNQVTQRIRADRTSLETERWNANRPWLVTVLEDNKRFAFSTPGGYFYISTGFLTGMGKGCEIYYLLAFEAANIEGRFLLDNLISEYSTATLLSLIDQPESFSPQALEEIAEYLQKDIDYEESTVQEIDKRTANLICETSIFDRFGIIPLLNTLHFQEQWRDTRPSYSDRLDYLNTLNIADCGGIKATGAYKKMVLENLE